MLIIDTDPHLRGMAYSGDEPPEDHEPTREPDRMIVDTPDLVIELSPILEGRIRIFWRT